MRIQLKLVGSSDLHKKHHNEIWDCELDGIGNETNGLHSLKYDNTDYDFEIQVTKIIGGKINLFGFLTCAENCGRVCFEIQ